MTKNIILKIYIILFMFTFIYCFNTLSYAYEAQACGNYTQIDLKQNINRGTYGDSIHYFETIDTICKENSTIVYGSIKDNTTDYNILIEYDDKGNELKRLTIGTGYVISGKLMDCNENIILLTYQKTKTKPSIFLIDNDLNIIDSYIYDLTSGSAKMEYIYSMNDKYISWAVNTTGKTMQILNIDRKSLENDKLNVTCNLNQTDSLNDLCYIYSNGKDKMYGMYCIYSTVYYCYLFEIDPETTINKTIAKSKNVWLNCNGSIISKLYLSNSRIYIEADKKKYVYDIETKETKETKQDDIDMLDFALANDIEIELLSENSLPISDNVTLNIYKKEDGIVIETDNGKIIDSIFLKWNNKITLHSMGDSIIISNNDMYEDVIADKNGCINFYKENIEHKIISEDIRTIHKTENGDSFVYLKNNSTPIIKIDKINGIDFDECGGIINSGKDGLTIDGVIENNNKTIDAEVMIGNSSKKITDVINDFKINFSETELADGFYDSIKIKLDDKEYITYYFDELELGSEYYYDNVLYTKIDTNLGYEKYTSARNADKRSAIAKLSSDEINNLITDAEYKKCSSYIYDDGLYPYWTSNINAISGKKLTTVKSTNSKYLAYQRLKKQMKLNDSFRYNEKDNKYYYSPNDITSIYEIPVSLRVSYKDFENINCCVSNTLSNDYIDMTLEDDIHDGNDVVILEIENESKKYTKEIKISEFNSDAITKKYDMKFEEEGTYIVYYYVISAYGQKSKKEKVEFEIDKTCPYINNITYENVYEYNGIKYSNKNINNILITVTDKNEIFSSLGEIIKKNNDIYEIILPFKNGDETEIEIRDKAKNVSTIKLNANYIIDDIDPLCDVKIQYYDDKAMINIISKDDVYVANTYYYVSRTKVNNPLLLINEFEKGKTLTLYKKDYNRDTYIYAYCVDAANNSSQIICEKINLNSPPILDIECKNEIVFSLDNIPKLNIRCMDEDYDDLSLSISLDDNEIYKTECQNNDEINVNFENYINTLASLQYDETYTMKILLSDGLDYAFKNILIRKQNMKPKFNVHSKKFNYKDYTELDIDINDLDNDDIHMVITKDNDILYDSNVLLGLNKVILKDLEIGDNKIKVTINDQHYKISKYVSINIAKEDKISENDILVLNISDEYDNEFYQYIVNKYKNACRLLVGLNNSSSFFENVYSIQDVYSSKLNEIINNYTIVINDEIDNDIANQIINAMQSKDKLYMVCGDTISLSDISFDDYDNDYRDFDRKLGVDRKVYIDYDKMNFENTLDDTSTQIDLYKNDTYDLYNYKIDSAGKYIIGLEEKDYALYDKDYSKVSDRKEYVVYAHNKPDCNLKYNIVSEDKDDITIDIIKDAYDKDYYSFNKGISKMKLVVKSYMFDGTLYDTYEVIYEDEKMFDDERITINKNHITKIEMYVYDFGLDLDTNEYILSNYDSLEFRNKQMNPYASFDYYLKDEDEYIFANNYVYAFDNMENLVIKENINYNDVFALNKKHVAHYDKIIDDIKDLILNTNEYSISNNLLVTNSYDLSYQTLNVPLSINRLDVLNSTDYNFDVEEGYKNPKDINFIIDVMNVNNKNDLMVTLNDIEMNETEKGKYELYLTKEYISRIMTKYDEENIAEFYIKIYSKRDNSYLGERIFTIKIFNNAEILDFYITNIYDKNIKANYPVTYNMMPVGDIKKGYAFDFDVITSGLSNNSDAVKINVSYFYLDESKNLIEQIILKKKANNKLISYDLNILFDNQYIGNLDNLLLTSKTILGDKEAYHGRFYVPSDALVLTNDKIAKNGYILVCFDIAGYQDGNMVSRFNEKWLNYAYKQGNCVIYKVNSSINDDFEEYGLY